MARKGRRGSDAPAALPAELPVAQPPLAAPSVSRVYKAPEWQDFGSLRGFRVNFSTADAFVSMLTVHQDTVNIWSHLLGLMFFVHAVPHTYSALQRVGTPWLNMLWFLLYLLCAQVQMLTSVLYHTLRCVNQRTSETFLYVDMVGIVCMIAGAYILGMTQGFYCSPTTGVLYLTVEAGILAYGMHCVSCALKNSKLWIYAYLAMGAAVAFGLAPCLHLYFLLADGEFHLEHSKEFLQRAFLGMGGNYFLGERAGQGASGSTPLNKGTAHPTLTHTPRTLSHTHTPTARCRVPGLSLPLPRAQLPWHL